MSTNTAWINTIEKLSVNFPLQNIDYPTLSAAIDEGVESLLMKSFASPSQIDSHYVEDLLADCINRISNCLVLREKAQDIEARAISDAVAYRTLKNATQTARATNTVASPLKKSLIQNASKITLENNSGESTINFSSDNNSWDELDKIQKNFLDEQDNIADVMKVKAATPGNGANYVERFSFIKKLFDIAMVESYKRALICQQALNDLYGINIKVPEITNTGYLNQLAIWAQSATALLDTELDSRQYHRIAFAVSGRDENPKDLELISKSKFNAGLTLKRIDFTLTNSNFESLKLKSLLLRGVSLQIRAKDESRTRLWSMKLKLPSDGLTKGDLNFPLLVPSSYQGSSEMLGTARGVHNINPVGDWTLTLFDRGVSDDDTSPVEIINIYLILDVSARRL
jgi:hypothetical protein